MRAVAQWSSARCGRPLTPEGGSGNLAGARSADAMRSDPLLAARAGAAGRSNELGAADLACGPRLASLESHMFGIGTTELLIVLGIVVVIFGARRLPELGSGLGKAIKNFKAGISGKDEIDVTPKPDKVTDGEKDR